MMAKDLIKVTKVLQKKRRKLSVNKSFEVSLKRDEANWRKKNRKKMRKKRRRKKRKHCEVLKLRLQSSRPKKSQAWKFHKENQTVKKCITLVFVGRSDSWQVCFLYRYLSRISFSDKRAMFFLGNLRFFSRVFRLSGSSFDLFLFDFLHKTAMKNVFVI